MLVTVSLMDEKNLTQLKDEGGGELAEKMDLTSECITLTTAGFDTLSGASRENLKKAIEIHLQQFGSLYLAALAFGLSRSGGMAECSRVIQESLDVLRNGVERMAIKSTTNR